MSRSSKPRWWSLTKQVTPFAASTRRRSRLPGHHARRPGIEALENRSLLTVSVSLSGSTVTFTSLVLGDTLNLKLDTSGNLEYSDNGSAFSSDLGGGSKLNVQNNDVTIDTQVASAIGTESGGVYLTGPFDTDGHSLTINGTAIGSSLQFLWIQGNVETDGGNFSVGSYTDAIVGVSAGVTITTRLAPGADPATAQSTGNSGTLLINVANSDPFNPLYNVDFNNPGILVYPGSQLLAQAMGSYTAGEVQLTATNEDYVLDGLSFPTLGLTIRQSTVNFEDSSTERPDQDRGRNDRYRGEFGRHLAGRTPPSMRRAATRRPATTTPRNGGIGSAPRSTTRCRRSPTFRS